MRHPFPFLHTLAHKHQKVLEAADGGGKEGRLLWGSVSGSSCIDAGRSALPHHIQCDGRCSGETLAYSDGRGYGGA